MDRLLTVTALIFALTTASAWGQMTPNRPLPRPATPPTNESQLVPGAQAPFPVTIETPSEVKKETAAVGSGSSTPPPQQKAENSPPKVKVVATPVPRKSREKRAVATYQGDSTANDLNRQELSRITGGRY